MKMASWSLSDKDCELQNSLNVFEERDFCENLRDNGRLTTFLTAW